MNWEANLLSKVPLSFYCTLNQLLIVGVYCENIWYVFPSLVVRILRAPMPVQSFFLWGVRPAVVKASSDIVQPRNLGSLLWRELCEITVRSYDGDLSWLRSWISVQALAPGPFLNIGLPVSGCVLGCVSCWLDFLAWPQNYLIALNLFSDHWTIGWF